MTSLANSKNGPSCRSGLPLSQKMESVGGNDVGGIAVVLGAGGPGPLRKSAKSSKARSGCYPPPSRPISSIRYHLLDEE